MGFNLLGRVFPGTRSNLHSFLDDAGYSYIGTLGEKDDLFVKSSLLEGKYKFDREEVSEEEWPEFSVWDGDQVVWDGDQVDAEKNGVGANGDLLVNNEKQRAEKVNKEVDAKGHSGTSPNKCWSKAVASGHTFALLKNTFWQCWLTGAL